jgi:hypothetical protein
LASAALGSTPKEPKILLSQPFLLPVLASFFISPEKGRAEEQGEKRAQRKKQEAFILPRDFVVVP